MARIVGLLITGAFAASCSAAPDLHSMSSDFSDNPFIAIGFNPTTRIVTGYFSGLLTAPGKTDECKFGFRGTVPQEGKVRLSIKNAVTGNHNMSTAPSSSHAFLTSTQGTVKIELPIEMAPGDCDWVLESIGGPKISKNQDRFTLSAEFGPPSKWIGVVTINSKRAVFHNIPDASASRKSFLVAGDVAFVIEEKPGWYYVKFTHGKKETIGWIKASDTIQF